MYKTGIGEYEQSFCPPPPLPNFLHRPYHLSLHPLRHGLVFSLILCTPSNIIRLPHRMRQLWRLRVNSPPYGPPAQNRPVPRRSSVQMDHALSHGRQLRDRRGRRVPQDPAALRDYWKPPIRARRSPSWHHFPSIHLRHR